MKLAILFQVDGVSENLTNIRKGPGGAEIKKAPEYEAFLFGYKNIISGRCCSQEEQFP